VARTAIWRNPAETCGVAPKLVKVQWEKKRQGPLKKNVGIRPNKELHPSQGGVSKCTTEASMDYLSKVPILIVFEFSPDGPQPNGVHGKLARKKNSVWSKEVFVKGHWGGFLSLGGKECTFVDDRCFSCGGL
jgi:hypothetical protein